MSILDGSGAPISAKRLAHSASPRTSSVKTPSLGWSKSAMPCAKLLASSNTVSSNAASMGHGHGSARPMLSKPWATPLERWVPAKLASAKLVWPIGWPGGLAWSIGGFDRLAPIGWLVWAFSAVPNTAASGVPSDLNRRGLLRWFGAGNTHGVRTRVQLPHTGCTSSHLIFRRLHSAQPAREYLRLTSGMMGHCPTH